MWHDTVGSRIEENNAALEKTVKDALNAGKKRWSFIIPYCSQVTMKYWLKPLDGTRINGEQCNFNFNHDLSKFDTGKPGTGKYMPVSFYYKLTNNGSFVDYLHHGIPIRPDVIRVRNIGKKRKVGFYGGFQQKINGRWIPYV